ncbi:acyl-CoA desaturase [Blastopirellula marina]|uniref:Delta-9 desaturase n=1 Tax=Blastopirellula marina DSM 3645 TaxID=314230 RepID=A4A2F0_9BACT|nr:fatty acid desaturase [Blastopirellula marina]EAQ77064.1 delta-9 desaturase [Blastopirellula marina DSM 3645]
MSIVSDDNKLAGDDFEDDAVSSEDWNESNLATETKPTAKTKKTRKPRRIEPPIAEKLTDRYKSGFAWIIFGWLAGIHVVALAAPFYFSWSGFAIFVVFYYLTGCVGITLCFHRMLTHTSYQVHYPTRMILAFIGGLAGEGSALDWVAMHRKHHAHSDQPEDPHSPEHGGLWAHMWWLFPFRNREEQRSIHERWAPDLLKEPGMRFLDYAFIPSHLVLGGLMAFAGYCYGGSYYATSWVLWGMFARLVVVLHVTWFVNSASHIWGYTNYETTDKSKNLWWVALTAFGEGWHNNHHAYPRMANHGHKWWEFDLTYNIIRVMKWTGLAWNVVDYKKKSKDGSAIH